MSMSEAAATVNFDAALLAAAKKARAAYPAESLRIERGLAIALADGVTLLADGTALVQSQSVEDTQYRVNGHCTCRDAAKAPEGRCKHRWGKSLYRWAIKHAEQAQPEQPKYHSTYYPPSGEWIQGVAQWTDRGWHFVPEDGSEPAYVAIQALCLGGRLDLAVEENFVENVCHGRKGYDR